MSSNNCHTHTYTHRNIHRHIETPTHTHIETYTQTHRNTYTYTYSYVEQHNTDVHIVLEYSIDMVNPLYTGHCHDNAHTVMCSTTTHNGYIYHQIYTRNSEANASEFLVYIW